MAEVNDSRFDDWMARASARLVLYAAMLGGTLGGQALGIAGSMAFGSRTPALPLACSLVLEALAGALAGTARAGHPLEGRECLRISAIYSLALALVTVPLLFWTAASRAGGPAVTAPSTAFVFWGAAWLVLGTLLRAALMRLVSARFLARAT